MKFNSKKYYKQNLKLNLVKNDKSLLNTNILNCLLNKGLNDEVINPLYIDKKIPLYNGHKEILLYIKTNMIGYKFKDFILTKHRSIKIHTNIIKLKSKQKNKKK
jgi:ribosomal protein S19